MSNFNQWASAIGRAKSARRLSSLKLLIVQDRTLLPMELVHLGSLAGTMQCSLHRQTKRTK